MEKGCKNGTCIHASDCGVHGENIGCNCENGVEKMRELLRKIAYPKRGTDEENLDIFQISEEIQKFFSLSDLE